MEQEPQPSDGSLDRANVGYTTLYCANRHVRFGSKVDIAACLSDVRFSLESGHWFAQRLIDSRRRNRRSPHHRVEPMAPPSYQALERRFRGSGPPRQLPWRRTEL
jgi:hypothetical protein